MKLVTFQVNQSGKTAFGVLMDHRVIAVQEIPDMSTYLLGLPETEQTVRAVLKRGLHKEEYPVHEIRFLPPVPNPAALIDFSIAPKHLSNSFKTLLKYEYSGIMRWVMAAMMKKNGKKKKSMGMLEYYKGNPAAISGQGDEIFWPDYTAFLDPEAELAFITGNDKVPIAGYTLLNDWSARDVQMPEIFSLSLTRSKDFRKSNGLGPWLVTPDEIGDPMNLNAEIRISDRYVWKGNTSGYSASPLQVLEYLRAFSDPAPGTVIGMGTVPGCCGLEHDLWVKPGDRVEITIEGLGTLTQHVPKKQIDFSKSRWKTKR